MTNCINSELQEKDCCGCEACVNRCPRQCIKMEKNSNGFYYPTVDENLCISCGLCVNACPILTMPKKNKIIKLFGGYCRSNSIVEKSSSGGAFYCIASNIINMGGKVCGVVIGQNYHVHHIIINSINELPELFGSKYVQSEIGTVYQIIKDQLVKNIPVLFTGCPCQVAGLKSFLGISYENLYTVEFICHGVPSPGVWEDYIHDKERKLNSEIVNLNFRSKSRYGWRNFEFYFEDKNSNQYYFNIREDLFLNGFLENLYLRPCCYECRFKGMESSADISIADFWGSEKFASDFAIDQELGLSLVTIFTEAGLRLFHKCKQDFI